MDNATADRRFRRAALEALQAWDLDRPELQIVEVSENITYRVDTPSDAYVLRVHRPGYHTLAELDSERVWTAALTSAGVEVPESARAADGRHFVAANVGVNDTRFVGITRWIPGQALGETLDGADADSVLGYFDKIGAIAAAIHNQSSVWQPPAGFTRHSFDVDGFFGPEPFWGPFWESPVLSKTERRLVLQTRSKISQVLENYGTAPRTYSLIHADLHFGNVLIDGEHLAAIDFDDSGFGWHQYELAVILHGHHSSDLVAKRDALLRGYRRVRPFADEDAALIDMFVVIRSLAILGWIEQRPELRQEDRVRALKDEICTLCAGFRVPA